MAANPAGKVWRRFRKGEWLAIQMRIEKSVKHLWWSFFLRVAKSWKQFAVIGFNIILFD